MQIRWKLLIILLAVALPPMILIGWFDRRTIEEMGSGIAREQTRAAAELAHARLVRLLSDQGRVLEQHRLRGEAEFRHGGGGDPHWRTTPDGVAAGTDQPPVPFAELLAGMTLPESWRGAALRGVVDPTTGFLVLRQGDWPTAAELPGSIVEPLAAAVAEGRAGAIRTDLSTQDHFVAFGAAGGYPLGLVVAVPANAVLAEAARAEERVARAVESQTAVGGTAVLIFALVAIMLSLIAARSITGPLKTLTRAAGRIAEGDLSARAEVDTGDELEELADSFNAMVPNLQDRLRMRDALGLAMEVQQNLLPSESPTLAGFDFGGRIIYCDETGGDYYDFLDLSDLDGGHVGVAVGDVAGHGVAAALLMTTARALLRSRANDPSPLSDMMDVINRHLSRDAHRGRFMTLFYGVIEARSRSLRWVNAGHDPALIYDPGADTFIELAGDDIPLGIDASWRYREHIHDIGRDGLVVAIATDGVWEARDPGGRMFGRERFREVIRANVHAGADDICVAVADAVTAFRDGRPQEDDATVVAIKIG